MPVRFYMDVHVPEPLNEQLRRRGVDVLTAIENGAREWTDEELLERSRELGRVIFTQDYGFRALAEQWQRDGREFAGLLFGRQQGVTIGQFLADLQLIAQASQLDEWLNAIEFLPLR